MTSLRRRVFPANLTMIHDHEVGMQTTTVPAGEFKAKCLQLIDEVAATGESLTITKRGRPVAQVVALPGKISLFGAMAGTVLKQQDLVAPTDDAWDAEC